MRAIRTLTATIALCALTFTGQAQTWTKGITAERPTFNDIQRAFNDYWEPYNVVNGRYMENGRERKAPGWKQFKRWEYYWEQRVGPTGRFPSNLVECEEWKNAKVGSKRGGGGQAKGASNWSSLGPSTAATGGNGRINCIAFHPTNANTFWVGTPAGGMWKTTNGGVTWSTNTDDLPVLGVSSIAIHPTDPDIMYIATGDGDGALSLSAFGQPLAGDTKSIGVLKSTDGGSTWTQVLSAEQNEGVLIRKVIIDPVYPDYVFAATNVGIFLTENAGTTWSNVLSGYFMDIEYHPTNSDITYASSYDPGGNAQVFVSYNVGADWQQTTNLSGEIRIEIGVTPAAPDAVDILCSDAAQNGLNSLHYSTDQGGSWAPYFFGGAGSNLLGWMGDASDADGQGNYDLAFAIDPDNYANIFVGGVNTWRTADGGNGWFISNMWIDAPDYASPPGVEVVHADHHFLAFHPLQSSTLFDCNDGGVYKSTDGGNTWTNLTDGLAVSQMYSISSSQTDAGLVVAGLQDNGSIGLDQGSWTQITSGDGMMCHVDPTDANYIYTSYASGVLYRVDLAAQNVYTISQNLPGGQQSGEWVTPFVIDPFDANVLYAGFESLYRSDDRGDSWSSLSTPLPGTKMNYLTVSPADNGVIYAGYLNALARSTDGGNNWTDITDGLPVGSVYISSITADPGNADAALVTMSGYSAGDKVFLTTNGGASWSNVTGTGLPNLPANCSMVDPVSGTTFLGTDAGVYIYDGGTDSWVGDNSGLPNVVVTDLDIQFATGKIRAGTFGRGLWETDFNVEVSDVARTSGLSAYPNPARGIFTLRVDDLTEEIRSVEMVNSTGRSVLREGFSEARGNRVNMDASGMANGIYLLTVLTNKTRYTERLVLER